MFVTTVKSQQLLTQRTLLQHHFPPCSLASSPNEHLLHPFIPPSSLTNTFSPAAVSPLLTPALNKHHNLLRHSSVQLLDELPLSQPLVNPVANELPPGAPTAPLNLLSQGSRLLRHTGVNDP